MSSTPEIPKTMKAIQVEKTGGPEVNVLNEIPVPVPKDDEVLIKVQWSGINFIDNYFRSGLYPKPLPYTAGQDAVGTLLTLPRTPMHPTSLPTPKIGDRVLTTAANAFAEYLTVPWGKIAVVPDSVDSRDAVAASTTAITAVGLVRESYVVKRGDWVLIRAAAGGVGTILVQLCKYKGANVIGTTSSEEKAKTVKEAGADHVLLTTASSEENVKEILNLTGGEGVKVVYDGVGKDTWEENFEVIRRLGTIVTFGNASGAVPPFAPLKLAPKALKVTRPTLYPMIATPEEFSDYAKEVSDTIQAGALKFTIFKEYGFTAEDVAQAERDISGRGTVGKLVIKVSD